MILVTPDRMTNVRQPEPLVWLPCAHCWQAGRIYEMGLRDWDICTRCLGTGQIPVVPR